MNKRWIFVIAATVFFATIGGYVIALKSEAYEQANEFVKMSSFIKQKLGDVREVKLHPFGYSIKISGVSGRAEFSCTLVGMRGDGELSIVLLKDVGVWRVSAATLNGANVPLF